jgi:glucan 1,3-beta-glucosidase
MKLLRAHLFLVPLLTLPNPSTADFGSGREIAKIQALVSSLTSEFAPWVTFRADPELTPNHGLPPKEPSPPPPPQFWLGNITHQGVAPFAEPGYQVFRNVRDFGAKGAVYPFSFFSTDCSL